MLHPYLGSRTREHFGPDPGPHSTETYGIDTSGTVTYRFNDLGYRCDDYDEHAERKVFVCGCSHTFGTGLDVQDTWPFRFSELYARHAGIERSHVCLMNFSQGGSSNKYIARTLMTQSAADRPDVVLAQFSDIDRTEYYLDSEEIDRSSWPDQLIGTALIGPWLQLDWFDRVAFRKQTPRAKRRLAGHLVDWTGQYYRNTYTELNAVAETVLQILGLQHFCESRGIPYLFACIDHDRLFDRRLLENPALAPLLTLLNRKRLLPFAITDDDVWIDTTVDGRHPGASSSRIFAARLWEVFLELRQGSEDLS